MESTRYEHEKRKVRFEEYYKFEDPFLTAYCPRCLFWFSETWILFEAECQDFSFTDPCFHLKKGRDVEGDIRINELICPICTREKRIEEETHNDRERKRRYKYLDDLIGFWRQRGLVRGMSKRKMDHKRYLDKNGMSSLYRGMTNVRSSIPS
jgi:hypothetical protein